MAESVAKTFYPALFSKLEKKKQAAKNAPLSIEDINVLLSIYFNGKALYPSIEAFFSEEYKSALEKGITGETLDSLVKFRSATEQELHLLYCDVHARDDLNTYKGSNQPD